MNATNGHTPQTITAAKTLGDWIQEPMGSVITASVLAMGSLGIVLSGIWFVDLILN